MTDAARREIFHHDDGNGEASVAVTADGFEIDACEDHPSVQRSLIAIPRDKAKELALAILREIGMPPDENVSDDRESCVQHTCGGLAFVGGFFTWASEAERELYEDAMKEQRARENACPACQAIIRELGE